MAMNPAQSQLFNDPLVRDDLDLFGLEADRGPIRIERELWTSRQRQAHSLQEVSYRACFKPQLPHYFISRLTSVGDRVYDPFSGRGTTVIEAALMGRKIFANDINPLSEILARPRIQPPAFPEVMSRVAALDLSMAPPASADDPDLSPFYHPETERELRALRLYLMERRQFGLEDELDRWVRMVATNRLTGHSPGFFSVYTLPPNQATTPERQHSINVKLNQKPTYRDVRSIIGKKSKQLLADLQEPTRRSMLDLAHDSAFCTGRAQKTVNLPAASVDLTVTSPPFLDIVQYADDNWLRCWFNGIDSREIAQGMSTNRTVEAWSAEMADVLIELHRLTKAGGHVAFEVGEVRGGKIRLDEIIGPLGIEAGFVLKAVLINAQVFTKTSNIWGISNNRKGTNTNRIVLFQRRH